MRDDLFTTGGHPRPIAATAIAMATLAAMYGTPALAQDALAAGVAGTAAAGRSACSQITNLVGDSCQRSARADYLIELAKCADLADAAGRTACTRDAGGGLREARASCGEQETARAKVCKAIGEAPYDPVIRPANFTSKVTNPYLPWAPGTVLTYRAKDSVVTVTVQRKTVKILGVECTVVRDTNVVKGKIAEDTLDYYAQDRGGNVWYFGESTAEFVDGVAFDFAGSFVAGIDGAKPGIVMPAVSKPGVTYRQEYLIGEAEDLARTESLHQRVTVPLGTFDTLKTFEITPLEPDARENKYYARGVGQVLTVDLETGEREVLVKVKRP